MHCWACWKIKETSKNLSQPNPPPHPTPKTINGNGQTGVANSKQRKRQGLPEDNVTTSNVIEGNPWAAHAAEP